MIPDLKLTRSYLIAAIVVVAVVGIVTYVTYNREKLFASFSDVTNEAGAAIVVESIQSQSDYDLSPCINQYTGAFAYFKTDTLNSQEVILTFVNQAGDIIVQDLLNGKVYRTLRYEASLCVWKQN